MLTGSVGVSALIVPLVVAQQLIRFDIPLMVGVSLAVLLLAMNGSVGRLDGVLLVAGLGAYLVSLFRQNAKAPSVEAAPEDESPPHLPSPKIAPDMKKAAENRL